MKRIVISLFALSLLGTLAPVVAAQDNQSTKDNSSIKQDAKGTGQAAGEVGKNTGKVALAGTKKGLSKAGSVLGRAANKLDKGNKNKGGTKDDGTNSTQKTTG